jgi:carbon-monoxide dehydrogenase small subunit
MTSSVPIVLNINDREYRLSVEPHRTLLEVLRRNLGLKGTKQNCQEGECGACTVLVDGLAVNSCLYLAVRASEKKVRTIEGLGTEENLHPVQEAYIQHGGIQCGYCTPGFIMSTVALLESCPHPSDDEITQALAGNICRCTGYVNIRRSVQAAVERRDEEP